MSTRFVNIDRDTPLLLPPELREWVPANHLAHFILDAVESIDLRQARVNTRGTGDAQYPPSMLLGLLVYSYATGVFGIGEAATPACAHTVIDRTRFASIETYPSYSPSPRLSAQT